jgi:hypothetical protein
MLKPTIITWILVVFGVVFIFLFMVYFQTMMATGPNSQKTKDLIIGKGEDWRDESHFLNSYGHAWADLLFFAPLFAAGSIGVLMGRAWGYTLWAVCGAITVYINIILWFTERPYVYPAFGPLSYYTWYWGMFVYWGVAAVTYATLRLSKIKF